MKRDMDLTRTLMQRVEALTIRPGATTTLPWNDPLFNVPGYSRDEAIRHFDLILDSGFIEKPKSQGADQFAIKDITSPGHDFLDATRNPEIWEKTKSAVKKVGGVGLDILVSIAKAETKRVALEKLGLSL